MAISFCYVYEHRSRWSLQDVADQQTPYSEKKLDSWASQQICSSPLSPNSYLLPQMRKQKGLRRLLEMSAGLVWDAAEHLVRAMLLVPPAPG